MLQSLAWTCTIRSKGRRLYVREGKFTTDEGVGGIPDDL
jgi:hypothetical protein